MVRNLCKDRSNKGHKGVQYHSCDICSKCKSPKTLIVILISSMRSLNTSVFCAFPDSNIDLAHIRYMWNPHVPDVARIWADTMLLSGCLQDGVSTYL